MLLEGTIHSIYVEAVHKYGGVVQMALYALSVVRAHDSKQQRVNVSKCMKVCRTSLHSETVHGKIRSPTFVVHDIASSHQRGGDICF